MKIGNSQTGKENGQNPSGEQTDNPYDSIERPSQSDTVEIIPGAPSDSKKTNRMPIPVQALQVRRREQPEILILRMDRKMWIIPETRRAAARRQR